MILIGIINLREVFCLLENVSNLIWGWTIALQVDKLKTLGNKSLNAGDITSAIQNYSLAIQKLRKSSDFLHNGIADVKKIESAS